MTCAGFDQRVALYVGGELDRAAAAAVEAHLASCADCRMLEAGLRLQHETMADWRAAVPTEEALADMRGRVLAAVARGDVRRPLANRLRVAFVTPLVWRTASIAALVLVFWAVWFSVPRPWVAAPGTGSAARYDTVLPADPAAPDSGPRFEARALSGTTASSAAPPVAAAATGTARDGVARRARRMPTPANALEPVAGPLFQRIEYQTADPNVRIIWLLQDPAPAATPGARQPGEGLVFHTVERRSVS